MPAYLNVDRMTAREVRGMRLSMLVALAALDGQSASDETLDAINTLIEDAPGARDVALHFARAMAFAVLGAAGDDDTAGALLRLTALALEAAEDVKYEIEFDEGLDHWLTHGWSGGGPDPECPHCIEEDA